MKTIPGLENEIKEILYGYVKCKSFTGTSMEKTAEDFFLDYFGSKAYFRANPELYGAYPIENDKHGRAAVWAMVKGKGPDTVVLIHHNDVVGVEDFKLLSDFAFSPDLLAEKLKEVKDTFAEEAKADFESGGYLFGRGVCDMKGGGAIQMALLSHYAELKNFWGNVIVLGVPDEENLSAGMRAGVKLLAELKDKYSLKYKLMINSEPHQRRTPEEGVFSFGSIGKMMPFVYARGSLSHAGKVFEGLNPSNVMAEIVRRTEVNMDMSDSVGNEAAPPPTWLYLRENKEAYDVSMPLTVTGCLNVLTLNQTPAAVMKKLRGICEEAFEKVIADMNENYGRFLRIRGQEMCVLPWKSKVVDFGELFREAEENHGSDFTEKYALKIEDIGRRIEEGTASLITANFELVDFIYGYIDDLSPRVVIGLVPPYYPNVSNAVAGGADISEADGLYEELNGFVRENFGQNYVKENYYTGISDLSYSRLIKSEGLEDTLKDNMPFFGSIYSLPVSAIEKISMPCVNIGPWGKDFHKLTERVLKEDLYRRTPAILDFAIKKTLNSLY